MQVQSVRDLAVKVAQDPILAKAIVENPALAIANVAAPAPIPDTLIYKIVVGSLGAVVVLAVIGSIVLAALNKTSPEILVALGSAAVGALAGLLAPSPTAQRSD